MGRIPIGIKEWKYNPKSNVLELYCSTYYGMRLLADIELLYESTYRCRLNRQWNQYDIEVLHGTEEEVKKQIENDVIKAFEKEAEGLKRQLAIYEDFIYRFKGEEHDSNRDV